MDKTIEQSKRVLDMYALWSQARELGTPFNLDDHCASAEERRVIALDPARGARRAGFQALKTGAARLDSQVTRAGAREAGF
jgi:hypothetical protein